MYAKTRQIDSQIGNILFLPKILSDMTHKRCFNLVIWELDWNIKALEIMKPDIRITSHEELQKSTNLILKGVLNMVLWELT